MADPINLNRARKARARLEADAKARENRVKFGRTKTERRLEAARAGKAAKNLEAGKLDR